MVHYLGSKNREGNFGVVLWGFLGAEPTFSEANSDLECWGGAEVVVYW